MGTRTFVRRALGVAIVVSAIASSAQAQALRNADEPAEFPPASFTGKQYVDSKGCVYIRAGIDGNTTWVPRVSRARKHVCGQTPSLTTTQIAKAPAAPVVEAPVISITPEPTAPVVAAPAPRPAPVAAPQPARRVVTQAKPRPAPAPKPRVVAQKRVVQKPVVVPQAPRTQVVATGPCPGASAVSQRYLQSSKTVRCGPQAGGHGAAAHGVTATGAKLTYGTQVAKANPVLPVTKQPTRAQAKRAAKHGLAPATSVHQHALIVPKHVYAENVAEQQHTLHVPKGYRPAWDDDRLNPRRAYGTLAHKVAMDLVWTRTLPRRLIDKHSGRDVTSEFPTLYYPFTSQAQLEAARLAMAQGKKVKVRVKHAHGTAHVSTKSTPKKAQVKRKVQQAAVVQKPRKVKAASHRFVQVGTYGDPTNTRNAVRRLQAAGLPVKIGKMTRKGRPLEMVLAGPFRTQDNLNRALQVARRAGFGDAIFRK